MFKKEGDYDWKTSMYCCNVGSERRSQNQIGRETVVEPCVLAASTFQTDTQKKSLKFQIIFTLDV